MTETALRVLIVPADADLAAIWARFLGREGLEARIAGSPGAAFDAIRGDGLHALILDIEAPEALAVADFAAYRCPGMPVIPVSGRTFFSESAILQIIPNAHCVQTAPVDPADLAAVTDHYARRYRARASAG